MESYNMWSFVTASFTWHAFKIHPCSMDELISVLHLFLFLLPSNIPLYRYTVFCLFSHLPMDRDLGHFDLLAAVNNAVVDIRA